MGNLSSCSPCWSISADAYHLKKKISSVPWMRTISQAIEVTQQQRQNTVFMDLIQGSTHKPLSSQNSHQPGKCVLPSLLWSPAAVRAIFQKNFKNTRYKTESRKHLPSHSNTFQGKKWHFRSWHCLVRLNRTADQHLGLVLHALTPLITLYIQKQLHRLAGSAKKQRSSPCSHLLPPLGTAAGTGELFPSPRAHEGRPLPRSIQNQIPQDNST